jgi:flagellar basal-body rod protein FlgB
MTRLDDAFRFQEAALRVRSQRQELIASNIANADTPNYKAKDMDFASALRDALGSGAGLTKTSGAHFAANSGRVSSPDKTSQSSVGRDGNGVNLDRERGAFIDNALRYEASVNMVNGQVKSLLSVIQG